MPMRFPFRFFAFMLLCGLPLSGWSLQTGRFLLGPRAGVGITTARLYPELYRGLEAGPVAGLSAGWILSPRVSLDMVLDWQGSSRGVRLPGFVHSWVAHHYSLLVLGRYYFRPLDGGIAAYLAAGGGIVHTLLETATTSADPALQSAPAGHMFRGAAGIGISIHFACIGAYFQMELLGTGDAGSGVSRAACFGTVLSAALLFMFD